MEKEIDEDLDQKTSGNGLICFKDITRLCGPDCMAYLSAPPQGKTYMGAQWANCLLLVNSERVGRHLTVLTQTVSEYIRKVGAGSPPEVK